MAFSDATTSITSLSNLILVTPQKNIGYQPQSTDPKTTLDSLLFHYEGEQSVTLESDITDHYVEDNTVINDNIALRPETITTQGFIGELNNVIPEDLAVAKLLADKLTIVDAYTPQLSTTALIAFNNATQLYQIKNNAQNSIASTWSSLNKTGGLSSIDGSNVDKQPSQNKQQQMFQQFYIYWRNRTLFTVQTPWAIFKNMAIRSLRAVQDSETRMITDFEVSFKIIRFADDVLQKKVLSDRASNQKSEVQNNGTSTPAYEKSITTMVA
jgi:hypothetical protein